MDGAELQMRIEQRTAELRAGADLPAGFEQELDERFSELVPPDAAFRLPETINKLRVISAINVDVPTESTRFPPLRVPKTAVRFATAWYLRYVADQVSTVGRTAAQGFDLVEDRLRRLEDRSGSTMVDSMRLVNDLDADVSAAASDGSSVNRVESLEELADLPPGSVETLLVEDLAVTMNTERVDALIVNAARALVKKGTLLISSATPAGWAATDPVQADLGDRRPLHAESWVQLLDSRGFESVRAQLVPGQYVVAATKSS